MTDPSNDRGLEFASLLCSRLCHDLMSPVGSVTNGLELLDGEEDPALRGQYLELLADSARASADKLKFFRLAFGAGGGFGERIDAREVRGALEGLVRGNPRAALGWLVDEPTLSRGSARLLLNLALIALDALVRGGRLDVGVEADEVVVRAEGSRLVLDAEVRAALGEDGDAALGARAVGVALIRGLAAAEARRLLFSEQEGVLLLGASRPERVAAPAAA